ncbi:MAG: DUF4874 domain-containing protein [Akkermansiaceae bacterium]|nr:DUF4874 domain-containing protein [Akkermansiaceae bacterium]
MLSGAAVFGACGGKENPAVWQSAGDDGADVINPERGFYHQRAAEDPGDLAGIRETGCSLVLLTLDLRNYRARELDDAKLSVLDEALRGIRAAGLKAIFRAAYGFTDADYRTDPQDLGRVRSHVSAMAEVLAKHAACVFSVQAGMLGPWGEWHGSVHGDPPSQAARLAVMNAWCDGLPREIPLQLRRPMFLRDMDADLQRVGFHNDALLAMPDDMGTYAEPGWDRQRELDWCAAHLRKVPFGGETVPVSQQTPPEQVMPELAKLRATYLNRGYHQGTLDAWAAANLDGENLLESVRRRLGYRLVPNRMEFHGGKARLRVRNDGLSAPMGKRMLSAGWVEQSSGRVIAARAPLEMAMSGLDPGDELSIELEVPESPRTACWPAVRFADRHRDLADDGRYAIRLLGKGIEYLQADGWNVLK